MDRTFLLLGAIFGFLGVALGAFGAHALRGRLSPEMLAVFETGVRYQMYHTLALLITGLVMARIDGWLFHLAGWCFVAGILIFSGSLYALALTGVTVPGQSPQSVASPSGRLGVPRDRRRRCEHPRSP
jgi:uncharacterized membrane protein YgdD (TMEM256/DUF423 family)